MTKDPHHERLRGTLKIDSNLKATDDSYSDGALYSHALLIFGIFYMTQVFYFIGIIVEKLYTTSK